jgi:hypothetical protein
MVKTMPRNNAPHKNGQKGNAFLIVLLGIALFAGLSFTVIRSMRGDNTTRISTRDIQLAITEIMDYGQKLERAANRIRRKGISENDISFQTQALTGYLNAGCAEDGCKVFTPLGGALTYTKPRAEWLDARHEAESHFGDWLFTGGPCIPGVGSGETAPCAAETTGELFAVLPYVKKEICLALNDRMGISNPGNDAPENNSPLWSDPFTGSYATTRNISVTQVEGKYAGCLRGQSNPGYYFYQVLIPR